MSGADFDPSPGRFTLHYRSEGAPEDDGIVPGHPKVWLTVKDGEPTWIELYFPALVYVNDLPRVFSAPGDRIAVSVRRGRQSISITKARKKPLIDAPVISG